jgi:hypothetical protein
MPGDRMAGSCHLSCTCLIIWVIGPPPMQFFQNLQDHGLRPELQLARKVAREALTPDFQLPGYVLTGVCSHCRQPPEMGLRAGLLQMYLQAKSML